MAIVKMQKVSIVGVKSEKNQILKKLQSLEFAEIIAHDETQLKKILGEDQYFSGKEEQELDSAEIKFAINFLDNRFTGKKPGLFESFIGNKIEASNEDIKKSSEIDYKQIVSKIKQIDNDLAKIDLETEKNNQEIAQLENFSHINFSLTELNSLANYTFTIGEIPISVYDNFLTQLNKVTKLLTVHKFKSSARTNQLYILYPNFLSELDKQKINKVLTDNKFKNAEFLLKYEGTIAEAYKSIVRKNKELQQQKKELNKTIQEYMQYRMPLMCVYDRHNWQFEANEEIAKAVQTNNTFILSAWIPKDKIKSLSKELKATSSNIALMEVKPDKNDAPPVALTNSKAMRPFEAVTNIYGMPKYTEPDPTPWLAIFFIVFLALCITDAGYGIIIILVTYLMLAKVKLPDTRLVALLNYGGWATLVIGALTGGWFGIDLNSLAGTPVGDFLINIRLVDPINDPITLMLVALTLGIIHIWFGIFVKFYWKLTHGQAKDAWLDEFPWLYLIFDLIIFVLGQVGVIPADISLYILYSGIALIALTQGRSQKSILLKIPFGLFKLYDLVGYLSDTLSYSRLLALGLATAIIGLVVNMIAGIFKPIPGVGWLLFLAILIGGHTFNLSINLLGAFIHSARLQYVEFFTKFLEGGGRRFEPFKRNNIYTDMK